MMSLQSIKCERGQAVVETTFSFLLFMMVFFGIVEFSHLFYTKVNMQHALSEAGRYMVTGQGIDLSGTDPNARLTIIKNKFCQNLIATGLSCADLDSHMTVTCAGGGGCAQPAGGPGQTVTLTAFYEKPWFTGLLNHILPVPVMLTASTTWVNELYM
jgi:Flp pilus assembly protein TadG